MDDEFAGCLYTLVICFMVPMSSVSGAWYISGLTFKPFNGLRIVLPLMLAAIAAGGGGYFAFRVLRSRGVGFRWALTWAAAGALLALAAAPTAVNSVDSWAG